MSHSADLYRSNLFKLQLEELIKETQLGTCQTAKEQKNQQLYSGLYKVEQYVRDLQKALNEIPQVAVPVKAGQIYAGVQIHQKNDMNVHIAPPTRIDMSGSYLLGSSTRPNLNVDVVLQMPEAVFEEKDFAQYRYFDKRAVYLAAVASHLSQFDDLRYADITITNFRGDPLKPVILIYPTLPISAADEGKVELQRAKGLLGKFVLRLFAVPSDGAFQPRKLAPTRNNLKEIEVQTAEGVHLISNVAPTPLYNQSILEDMFIMKHFYQLAETFSDFPLLTQVVSTLKVWGALRGLTSTSVGYALDVDRTTRVIRKPVTVDIQKIRAYNAALGTKKADVMGGTVMYEYSAPEDGFNGFLLAKVVSYLFKRGKITSNNDIYQCVYATLSFLATHDLTSTTLAFPVDADVAHGSTEKPSEATFAAAFDTVFVDASGFVNLTARVSASRMREVRHHALLALVTLTGVSALNNASAGKLDEHAIKSVHLAGANYLSEEEAFAFLFLEPVRFNAQYDAYVTVTLPPQYHVYHPVLAKREELNASVTALPVMVRSPAVKVLDGDSAVLFAKLPSCDVYTAVLRRAYPLLTRALTDRFYLATVYPCTSNSTKYGTCFTIGLMLCTEHAFRTMDKGPSADDKTNAPLFRAFWGDKSELRRFQDGTILESVLWTTTSAQAYTIPSQIVSYVFKLHLLPAKAHAHTLHVAAGAHPLDAFVLRRSAPHEPLTPHITDKDDASVLSLKAFNALKELEKSLHNLPEMPLSVKDVQPASSVIAGTAPFPPTPASTVPVLDNNALASVTFEPIEVVFSFTSSSRWPDDIIAITRVKTAFYLKMGNLLTQKFGYPTTTTAYYIDVCVNGFAFRLRLHHPREITLFRTDASNGKNVPLVTADGFFRQVERRIVYKPTHTQFIKGLAAQYPLLAPVARLVRRWINAHMFGRVLSNEAVDLLCAHVFVAPQPYSVPASLLTAFTRVLHLIAYHNWANHPLIVPSVQFSHEEKTGTALTLNSVSFEVDMDKALVAQVHAKFQQRRRAGTGAAMYIATRQDMESRVWTMRAGENEDVDQGDMKTVKLVSSPSVNELERIVSYARVTLSGLENLCSTQNYNFGSWASLFKTPLELFDAFIVIDPKTLGEKAKQSLFLMALKHDGEDETVPKDSKKKSTYKLPADLDASARENNDSAQANPVHAGFYPVDNYLNDLRSSFGHIAKFYYDDLGGRVIGVKFNSDFGQPVETPGCFLGKKPIVGNRNVLMGNKMDILDQMGVMGEGIVTNIYPSYTQFTSAIRY